MLNEEAMEKLAERLVRRIEEGNTYVMEQIGKSIKKIGTLTPTKAKQITQIMIYGGDFDRITQKIAEITELNIKDIYKIYEEVSRRDYEFNKYLYEYRNKKFIPYKDNIALQQQVESLARYAAQDYVNLTRTNAIGFIFKDINGEEIFKDLRQTYIDTLDRAVLSISQGKNTFDNEMYRVLKELGSSGVKTTYISGRTIRLDSAIRQSMLSSLRDMRYETQKFYGYEFGYDGWEISVHSNPAPDHEEVQGHQFRIEEYNNLQTLGIAKDIHNKEYDMHLELKSGDLALGFRPIRDYNCLHWEFPIIIGVSKPEYTESQLNEIRIKNANGFYLFDQKLGDYKHYTMYEGTQLQRRLETKIREQKDTQIMARAGGQMDLVGEAQQKITQLTRKYRELSKISGLPTRLDRARVPNYHRVAIKK